MSQEPTLSPHLDLSVAIITLNEENHIARCLRSLPKGAEIVVLDSGSSDATCDIAAKLGAQVITRPFVDYADQKNAAIAETNRSWVLSLDADETLTPELRASIEKFVAAPRGKSARLRRRLVFMNRAMTYGRTVDSPLRLFARDSGRFEAAIHEKFVLKENESPVLLNGDLLHYSYDSLSDYFFTFNRYTTLVAQNHFQNGRPNPALLAHIMRPWVEFVGRYFLKGGFLDGYPGYTYALLSAIYTYVKHAKLRELYAQRNRK